mmetsp:Transcript_18126/g.27183  ORF Transcript_18126/g.27183 Transcript_18126/m.27183 type:complete len:263 (+) Transcript_18126:158-946(+)|eukprot:CAMPEP_0203646852 /NCGR_PEP_ID=MMETSP0088-20131115/14011_1 /ASSEMBLY_ACC=CAM_ASM_001087 /TAXON_ID=426623 /ORGANISM="Chaetoceros affinis, Strain CCMP159" /LENGTH=262 /DNA_ID=CAMNT_0050504247 /DNA_START=275 /DNA_END=1063 /DNA_ORIENTATION=+
MSSSKQINNVVVAIAMEAEAKPFIEHLNLIQEDSFFSSKTPFLAYRGEHHSCQITVITNGKDTVHGMGVDNVGTVPAALATFLALEKLNSDKDNDSKNSNNVCDLVINAGTCGGFQRKGAEIGDVFFTTAVANHDRRIPLGPFEPYGVGKIESMDVSHLAEVIGAKLGVCTTGNSLDAHDIDDHHMKVNDASVKDMEAAAIAWSCQLHGTPYVGLKVVTDIVDGDKPTQEEFMENLGTAAKSLQEALPKVIEQVCGSKRDEL